MKIQPLSIIVVRCQFGFVGISAGDKPRFAVDSDVTPVVRCRAFQVVDDQGRARASISVLPAGTFQPTGKAYPETVIFRLIDAKGRPEVKIVASEEGGALGFVGQSDETQIQLAAEDAETSLKLTNKDGSQRIIKP